MADVSNEEDVVGMIERIKDDFGTIDILVNNAGIVTTALVPVSYKHIRAH